MKKPKKGQTWVGDFGRDAVKLTNVNVKNVFFTTKTGVGFMERKYFEQRYALQPKRRSL